MTTKEKIIFNSNKEGQDDVRHLVFSDGFEISLNEEKSKIILGSNGVGKTSIFREIRNNEDNHYIDYDTIKENFIKNGKEIIIGPKIKILQNKIEERELLTREFDFKNKIKEKFSISTQAKANEVASYLGSILKEQANAFTEFSDSGFDIIRTLPNDQIVFLLKNIKQIFEAEKTKFEILNIKNNFLQTALGNIEKYLSADEKVCPVCDTGKDETIRGIIKNKLKKLEGLDNELIKSISVSHPEKDSYEINLFLNNIKETIDGNSISIENILNFGIGGDDTDSMMKAVEKFKLLSKEIKKLEEEKTIFFDFLKTQEKNISDEFINAFEVSEANITFDEETKEIKIKLPRKIEQYSTGEINLMVFVVYMYEALASDKELVIIDDPLSSYDIINQYKIIYKIAIAHMSNKKLLIFTHNIDTINISNSQHGGIFEYQYIEKHKGELHIQDIKPIREASFLKINSFLTEDSENEKYIKLLMEKESSDDNSNVHKIFHYDEAYTDENGHTNDYLVGLIDAFQDNFENNSFSENCKNKIIYLTAIRVWVEKQFYNSHTKDRTLHGKQFSEKVNYLFPEGKPQKWTGTDRVTRSFLMSKKVMLNQNTHTESQSIPFEYAINLSLDNLAKEILEIKEVFKK